MGYLRLDARPTKQAIITWVTKWTYLFTSYLQSKVLPLAHSACRSPHFTLLQTILLACRAL